MHLACRYGGSHNAVKLVHSRAPWQLTRCLTFAHHPGGPRYSDHPDNLLGAYNANASPNPQARNIAVLGGGISGLATAWNLSKDIPHAKITIFEQKAQVGGWIDSELVEVDGGTALFEWGPRSLRPDTEGNGRATLQLINRLGDLSKHVRGVSYKHPAATNRYIYYPDHLVRMPAPSPDRGMLSNLFGGLSTILTEPIFKGVLGSLFAEPTVRLRPSGARDESVGSFVSRRFGPAVTDNMLSALFHGIYAGDIYNLSARALLPKLWYLENRDRDGNGVMAEVAELYFRGHLLKAMDQVRFINRMAKDDVGQQAHFAFMYHQMRPTSVYSFVKGIGQLTDAILSELEANSNITIKTSAKPEHMFFDPSNRKFSIRAPGSTNHEDFDYTVSSLSPTALHDLLQPSSDTATDPQTSAQTRLRASLKQGSPKSVNVMVVNLYYSNPDLSIPKGFGYLLPRSVPTEQNPERALGVIFASETAGPRGEKAFQQIEVADVEKARLTQQKALEEMKDLPEEQKAERQMKLMKEELPEIMSRTSTEEVQLGQDTAPGTKLAVMLGGHWWDGWQESDLPSEEEAIEMAKSVIERHLKISEQPVVAKARLQRECIPQYQIGYREDMAKIHTDLRAAFEGRLKLVGPWWQGGVGVNDCVRGAREASRRIREGWDDQTGLEDYAGPEKWVLEDMRTKMQVPDPLQKN